MSKLEYKTTKDIPIPKLIIDQVIGQEHAVNIIKKAALKRRNVLLIGSPGTGKSLIGQALAELLPKEKLVDILAYPNVSDENVPLIKTLPKGQGRILVNKARIESMSSSRNIMLILVVVAVISWLYPTYAYYNQKFPYDSPVIYAASIIGSLILMIGIMLFINLNRKTAKLGGGPSFVPKLLIDNFDTKKSPFLDATGAHAGALLGDVLHDPLQSGGLGTPAHERLIPGMIHRASGGVLFIDEISTLQPHSQQELLTALQEKKYPITGQGERSSGAMTRSEPAPTDFILVAAGNVETVQHMHPALRSRIRGYGYEVYMNNTMDDTPENRDKLAIFIAQEVEKDGKIPHFTKEAVEVMIDEARRMASTSGKLTARLRELGGLLRAAGDVAVEDNAKFVEPKHIHEAKKVSRSLEQQIADKYIEAKKKYDVIVTQGTRVGRVNGLAVMGTEAAFSGIVLPIESEVTPGGKKTEFVATGKLGEIAKEAVKNVSALILKYFGEDIREKYDVYIQFVQSTEGVEGDSASIAVATSIISSLKNVPIRQDTAMTGSLSVRGEVLAVGGVSAKIEAAIDAGIKRVIIPKTNEKDVVISKDRLAKIHIIPVLRIEEVIKEAMDWKGKEQILRTMLAKQELQ